MTAALVRMLQCYTPGLVGTMRSTHLNRDRSLWPPTNARVVAAAGIHPGELVLDIGAGDGALTAHLLRARARVIAVERATATTRFAMAAGMPLPRHAFQPRPRVDCAVLTVRRRGRP